MPMETELGRVVQHQDQRAASSDAKYRQALVNCGNRGIVGLAGSYRGDVRDFQDYLGGRGCVRTVARARDGAIEQSRVRRRGIWRSRSRPEHGPFARWEPRRLCWPRTQSCLGGIRCRSDLRKFVADHQIERRSRDSELVRVRGQRPPRLLLFRGSVR